MNRPQALAALKNLLPVITSSGDPAGTLIKAADERGWSPEQLQHVGQLYNTAKAVTFMDKVAMPLRGSQHTILDVPKMVTDFVRMPVKSARPTREVNSEWLEYPDTMSKAASSGRLSDDDWFEDEPIEKRASALPSFMSDIHQEDVLVKSARETVPAYRVSDIQTRTALNEELRVKEAAAHEAQLLDDYTWDRLEELNHTLTKFAKSPLFGVADEIEQDMAVTIGCEKVACVIRALEAFCETTGHRLKRAAAPAQGVVFDRHSARGIYEAIWDKASLLETAGQMKEAAQNIVSPGPGVAAAILSGNLTPAQLSSISQAPAVTSTGHQSSGSPAGKQPSNATTKGKGSQTANSKTPSSAKTNPKSNTPNNVASGVGEAGETLVNGLNTSLDTAQGGVSAVNALIAASNSAMTEHSDRMQGVVDALKPQENEHQRAVDDGARTALAKATIQQLLIQDDVIRSAEPHKIERLYTALVTEEPALATNPEALGIALREAIQYDGVAMHTMAELGKHRKTRLESERLESDQDRQRYAN